MVPMRNKFLVEEPRGPIKEVSNQLVLFEAEDKREFKEVKVIAVHPEEKDIKVGDVIRVRDGAGTIVRVEGERLSIVHKGEIISFNEA